MYFSGLHKSIAELTDQPFYDIALLFLSAKGFKNCTIVDGPNDGGIDVICADFPDLRIQLSVQKAWEKKLNDEAQKTLNAEKRHFIYITNRRIREAERADFIQNRYKPKNKVTIEIFDLDTIATQLALPQNIKTAYETLKLPLTSKLTASPQEVALSNTLLFSKEARELKTEIIESRIKSQLLDTPGVTSKKVVSEVANALGNSTLTPQISKSLRRLQADGEVSTDDDGNLTLSTSSLASVTAAKLDFLHAKAIDIANLRKQFSITANDAERFVQVSLEILARNERFDSDETFSIRLGQLIADTELSHRKKALFTALGSLSAARISQYGNALNHIFKADTFDILRALGRNTSVSALLDSSVAMPMLFGLTFARAQSRYSVGASALLDMCRAHQIPLILPAPYLSEMAFHGKKALEFVEIYEALGPQPREVLRASGNAYISHFGNLSHSGEFNDSLEEFLRHFGIRKGASLSAISDRLRSRLAEFDIETIQAPPWTPEIRSQVAACKKPRTNSIIIDNDAHVVALLKQSGSEGYLFATWDYALTALIEEVDRIYADTPSRIVDFLSMANPTQIDSYQTVSLVDSLIHCDQSRARALAEKIQRIKSAETAYEMQKFTDAARKSMGTQATAVDTVDAFFEKYHELEETPPDQDSPEN
jgi:hypothetical protein